MKKLCKALALTLSTVMLLSTFTVVGDPGGKTVLTLEEAKKIALDNDVQFKLQQSYIQQKSDDYDDVYDIYSNGPKDNYNTIVERAEMEVAYKLKIENAASAIRQEIFTRNDLKRKSNYDVTVAYYDVMVAKYALEDKERAMQLAKKDVDIAKIKLEHGLITKIALAQVENAYTTSQTEYNKAFSDLQNAMASLSRNIGKNLDVFNDDIDMTLTIPDVKTIDLNKIKEDYMKNCNDPRLGMFYSLKEQLDIAEYQQDLTEEKYDYYEKRLPHRSSKIEEALDDMKYKADRDYDNARYQYMEAEKALDVALNSMYTGVNTLAESVRTLQKSVEDTRTTFEQNKIRYELGLISKIEFEKSESALKDLENTLNTTIISLNEQYLNLTQYSYEPEK